MTHPEAQLQAAVVKFLRLALPEGALISGIDHATKSASEGERKKRMGVQRGLPDIAIWWNGSFYAIRNICPHQFGPVCNGTLRPLLVASGTGPRDLACDSSRPVITCPWHGWEFYVDSGRAVWSPGYRVRTYDVQVSDGRVYVNQPAGRDASDDE